MTGQLHITHRSDYLHGDRDGRSDAQAGRDYRPRDGAGGTLGQQRAYGLGYEGGYLAAYPCENGTCGHLAHKAATAP